MGIFDKPGGSFLGQLSSGGVPNAPAGLQQVAGVARGQQRYQESGGVFGQDSFLGRMMGTGGYTASASSWYTGANEAGVTNGWNTDFYQRMYAQNKELGEAGQLRTQFSSDDATGVVTWDHVGTDGETRFEFGDVFDHGEKVGNVYDQFDRHTADVMMADLVLPSATKNHHYAKTEIDLKTGAVTDDGGLHKAVMSVQRTNNEELGRALKNQDFLAETAQEAEELADKPWWDIGVFAAGAGGGAVIGGGAGTAVAPGPGTAIGALVGGVAGGVGAWMNQDALAESAARAWKVTTMANKRYGGFTAAATAVEQFAPLAQSAFQPTSNLIRGTDDWLEGDIGDGTSEFFRTDKKTGERQVGQAIRYLDVGGTVVDSLLQFASPLGVGIYSVQMGATIAGETTATALRRGAMFDFSQASFNGTWTDDEGNFDGSAAMAGIGKIGIDVVQLGMVRGLAGRMMAARTEAGLATAAKYGTGALRTRIPTWAGGWTAEQKAALQAGGAKEVEAAGWKGLVDEEGKLIGRMRPTASLLAPSEMLKSVSLKTIARREAFVRGGAYTTDDFYRTAHSLATGDRKITSALVNALGEGGEEGVQNVFENHALGHAQDGHEIWNAFMYGSAMGMGMGLGMNLQTPSSDERMFGAARLLDPSLTKKQWRGMSEEDKRIRVNQGGAVKDMQKAVAEAVIAENRHKQAVGMGGVEKVQDAVQLAQLDKKLKRGVENRVDAAFTITMMSDAGPALMQDGSLRPEALPAYGIVTSGAQMKANIDNTMLGLQEVHKRLSDDIAIELEKDQNNPDVVDRLAKLRLTLGDIERVQHWNGVIDPIINVYLSKMYAKGATGATIEADAITLNVMLRNWFNMQADTVTKVDGTVLKLSQEDKLSLARAVSQTYARDPHIEAGSYQVLVPQVSAALTLHKQDNVAQVSHGILAAIAGDYDGDKVRRQALLIQDDFHWTNARAGTHMIGAGTVVNTTAPAYEEHLVKMVADSIKDSDPRYTALQSYAEQTLLEIKTQIRQRYRGYVDDQVLDRVLEDFEEALKSRSPNARDILLSGLAQKAGKDMDLFARGLAVREGETGANGEVSHEWLWLDQLVRASLSEFQRNYVEHKPRVDEADRRTPKALERSTGVKDYRAKRAATQGLTLGLLLDGDSLFRMFQKIHFTSRTSATEEAGKASWRRGKKLDNARLAEVYEAIGRGITQAEIDELRGKDLVTSTVFAQLRRMARRALPELNSQLGEDAQLTYVETLSVLANMAVEEVEVDADGYPTGKRTGKTISLAQMLLKSEIVKDKQRNSLLLDVDESLINKYAELDRMVRPQSEAYPNGAEEAFIEIVGSQQFFTLLGNDSEVFGPQLTVEQWLRAYVGASEGVRKDMRYQLKDKTVAAYVGRKGKRNMPYGINEVRAGEITSYRSVVDALLAVGDSRVTMDEDTGKLKGTLVDRSDRASKNFWNAYKKVREALDIYRQSGGAKDKDTLQDTLARMFRTNREFERSLYALIPDDAVNIVFMDDGEGLKVSNWVIDMFLAKTPEHAEMILHRSVRMAEWNAMGYDPRSADDPKMKMRDYRDLKTRFHRVMWELAARDDGGRLYTEFMDEYYSSKNLHEFYAWMNRHPGIRGNQAPLIPWTDDTSIFDKDKAGGGWAAGGQGASYNDAIAALSRQAQNLVEDMDGEITAWEDDRQLIADIESGNTALYGQMKEAIAYAGQTLVGLGPQEILNEITMALWGMYANAHDKGKAPEHMRGPGSFEVQRDAFGHLTNYGRQRAGTTSVSIDDLPGHLDMVARGAGRTMDHQGRQVEWAPPTVEQFVEWLKDPETRGFARAVLFPQVMERNSQGVLRQQFLVGKSLRELLDGAIYNKMFPPGDELTDEAAMNFCSAVAAQERKYGGHFDLQRWAGELGNIRLSGAGSELEFKDIERMSVDIMKTMAKVLQATGTRALAHPDVADPNAGAKASLITRRKKNAKQARLSPAAEKLKKKILKLSIMEREKELSDDHARLVSSKSNPTTAESQEILDQVKRDNKRLAEFKMLVSVLMADNPTDRTVEMFFISVNDDGEYTDPVGAEARKKKLVDYVDIKGDTFKSKGRSATEAFETIRDQQADSSRNGDIEMDPKLWKALSQAAISIYLEESLYASGTQSSVLPFPDLDTDVGDQQSKYWDTSFSYALDRGFDKNSPLQKAAQEIIRRAGRRDQRFGEADLIDLVESTIFAEENMGAWTTDIPRATIETHTNLDSSASGAAVSMSGQSPKLEAVFSAAGERTYETEGLDALLSTTSLTYDQTVVGDQYRDVDVTFPNGTVGKRPIAQLNNRAARSVLLKLPDGSTYDLLAKDRNLGWPHPHPDARESGYEIISLLRLRQAMARYASDKDIPVDGLEVVIEFVHPDSQPAELDPTKDASRSADERWMNNLYFDGTSFILNADRHDSLNSTLWFANGSISPAALTASLQARKKARPAVKVVKPIPFALTKRLEGQALKDLAWVLRMKTQLLLKTDLGFSELGLEFYNSVYKDQKMRHFVRGRVGNKLVLWHAEQVIAWQQANPGEDLPFEDATLWVPTDPVLRTMLGEQGRQGVPTIFPEQLEVELTRVNRWRGVTPGMIEMFKEGISGQTRELSETHVVHQMRQTQLQVRGRIDSKQKSKVQERLDYKERMTRPIADDREAAGIGKGPGQFDRDGLLRRATKRGEEALRAENINLNMPSFGVPYVGSRDPRKIAAAATMLKNLERVLTSKKNNRTGWVFEEGGVSEPAKGVLTGVAFDSPSGKPRFRVMPEDLVVVMLDSFENDRALAQRRLDFLVGRGAYIVLVGGQGGTNLRGEMAAYLKESVGYQNLPGSNYIFEPEELDGRYQNLRAHESMLMAHEGISPENYAAVFLSRGEDVAENAGLTPLGRDKRLARASLTLDLVKGDFLAGFGLPTDDTSRGESQIRRVRDALRGMDNVKGREFLCDMAHGSLDGDERVKADEDFNRNFDALMTQFTKNPNSVLPGIGDEFGLGSIIPLVDNNDRIILYRHGYRAPMRQQNNRNKNLSVDEMTALEMQKDKGAQKLAMFPYELEPEASVHGGKIVKISPRAGHGLQIEMKIPMQLIGGKFIAEWQGMKYVLTDLPKHIKLPERGFLQEGEWGVDIWGQYQDVLDKEATGGLLDNHRMAFAVFGIEFIPYVARHFGVNSADAEEILRTIQNQLPRISVSAAHDAIRARSVEYSIRKILARAGDGKAGTASNAWVDELNNGSVDAEVTMAVVLYALTRGSDLERILRSGGFNDPNPDPKYQSRLMPTLFTSFFDRAPINSPLRKEMFSHFNHELWNDHKDGSTYFLDQAWNFHINTGPRTAVSIPGEEEDLRAPITPGTVALLRAEGPIDSRPTPIWERPEGAWAEELPGYDEKKLNKLLYNIGSILRVPTNSIEEIIAEVEQWQKGARRIGEAPADADGRPTAGPGDPSVVMYDVSDPRYGRASSSRGGSPLASHLNRISNEESGYASPDRSHPPHSMKIHQMGSMTSADSKQNIAWFVDLLKEGMPADLHGELRQFVEAAALFIAGEGSVHGLEGPNRREFDILRRLVGEAPVVDATLYRGLRGGKPTFDKHGMLTEQSSRELSSWSANRDVADKFTFHGDKHLLKVNGAKAISVGSMGGMDEYLAHGEYELVRSYQDPSDKNATIWEVRQIRVSHSPQTSSTAPVPPEAAPVVQEAVEVPLAKDLRRPTREAKKNPLGVVVMPADKGTISNTFHPALDAILQEFSAKEKINKNKLKRRVEIDMKKAADEKAAREGDSMMKGVWLNKDFIQEVADAVFNALVDYQVASKAGAPTPAAPVPAAAPTTEPDRPFGLAMPNEGLTTGTTYVGKMQFVEVHASSADPVKNGQAYDVRQGEQFSRHAAATAYQAIGADTAYSFDISYARHWLKAPGVERFDTQDSIDGGVWRMLTGIDRESRARSEKYHRHSPAEVAYTTLARKAMAAYRQLLEKNTDWGWDDKAIVARYEKASRETLKLLNLLPTQQALIDYWIRQRAGSPLGLDSDGVMQGKVSAAQAAEEAEAILQKVKDHDIPTLGGMVPMMHVHDLQIIYRANRGDPNGWNPRESMDRGSKEVTAWNQWVKSAIGSVNLSHELFIPLYLRATDGFFHSYQNATESMLDLPVSMDRITSEVLLDPETNMRLVSINPNIHHAKTQTLILDFKEAGIADLVGGVSVVTAAPAEEREKKIRYIRKWYRENNMALPVPQSMKNYQLNGDRFTSEATNTTAFIRQLIHLRVAMAMINPALYVAMGPEQWARGSLDRIANLATGQSLAGRVTTVKRKDAQGNEVKETRTTGIAGRMSRATQRGKDNLAARRADLEERIAKEPDGPRKEDLIHRLERLPDETLAARMGFSYRYSPKQMIGFSLLANNLGKLPQFKGMLYHDLKFRRPEAEADIGRAEKIFSAPARLGYKMQDPTHGINPTTLARRYLEGVMQHLDTLPESHTLTPEMVVAYLSTNPEFLRDKVPDAHKAGMEAIAQIRSLKQTMLNKLVRGFVDPMAESNHSGVNLFGNLVLKLPLFFSNYTFNVMTSITGMQGLDQFIAMWLTGRKKGIIGKAQAAIRGEPFDPERDAIFDFSDVIEGADLSRSFLRGGLTMAGLFQAGLMAGGLGLSGEDEETKRRRKLAEAQGAGFIYGPPWQDVENDFRNSDAIFLDWLPFNLDHYFMNDADDDPRAMAEMHWTIKQFMSPIIGMERFFETGDFNQVKYGFADAFGAFPLINAITFDDMLSTADEFTKAAQAEQQLGEPRNMINAMSFLTNAVGVYERMLMENAFINEIYISHDRYDRDPYALPLRNSSRELQGDIEGNPRENDLALERYYDPETGEIRTGYANRDQASATLHALTENRWSLATLLSIPSMFSGMADSDYYRTNMVIKTREIDLPDMPEEDIKGIIRALSEAATGGVPNLSTDEVYALMKADYAKRGVFVDYNKLYAQAGILARRQPPAPMSVLDKDGREQLTTEGAKRIVASIGKGSVQLGDEALAGLYITPEMRQEIQVTWMKEIVQEGIDLGLDEGKAVSRMKRLWSGPYEDPTVQGLGDILWSDKISFEDTLEYNQLNTTYTIGPDGKPWATGFQRDGFLGALGLKPLQRMYGSEAGSGGMDARLNVTDLIHGVNTGLRAIELADPTRKIPTDVEIGKSIEDAIKEAAQAQYSPYSPYKPANGSYGGYGYNRFGYGGYGGGGGYGGYSGGSSGYYKAMYDMPNGVTPYGHNIPFVNTGNVLIRRESLHRERISSERGRLLQWQ